MRAIVSTSNVVPATIAATLIRSRSRSPSPASLTDVPTSLHSGVPKRQDDRHAGTAEQGHIEQATAGTREDGGRAHEPKIGASADQEGEHAAPGHDEHEEKLLECVAFPERPHIEEGGEPGGSEHRRGDRAAPDPRPDRAIDGLDPVGRGRLDGPRRRLTRRANSVASASQSETTRRDRSNAGSRRTSPISPPAARASPAVSTASAAMSAGVTGFHDP